VIGFTGCCDNAYAVRMLLALVRHPNVGAVLSIGLGCEHTRPHELSRIASEAGKSSESFYIQEEGGTLPSVERGIRAVEKMLAELQEVPRVRMGVEDLIIGAECGGSDYTSGLAGNAVVGRFFDHLVDAGGTAIFEEIMEAIGLKDYLIGRAANSEARERIGEAYENMLAHCQEIHQYSISPGNFAGGLSSIEEKSMGAVVKSGSRPIQGVIKVSVPPPDKGLWLLNSVPDPHFMGFGKTNPNDNEGIMDLISCHCHLVFLITGRGSVVGSAVAPLAKITGNSNTYRRMIGDMDFDAGACISGEKSIDDMSWDLFSQTLEYCAGKTTKAESLGHKEYYIPYKFQEAGRRPCSSD
jgi:altronate hydrolase